MMTYIGYQPSMLNESEKHDFLMQFKEHPRVTSIVEQGKCILLQILFCFF